MTSAPTLHSRLRVLVAKTFRAEKLYSSIRNARNEKASAGPACITEIANDVRAKEWERCHYELRIALNDILAIGNNSSVLAEILRLRERFLARSEESVSAVDKGVKSICETARQQEFAHIFKISLELVRQKARAQSNRVIADELTAVLESVNRNVTVDKNDTERVKLLSQVVASSPWTAAEAAATPPSNVIPLKRRLAGGRRK